MSLVVPNTADILMLQLIVNMNAQDGNPAPAGGQRLLRLFTNNLTPGKTVVLGDLNEASTLTGYVPHTLVGINWSTSSMGGVNTAAYSTQTFPFSTGVTIYGYFVTDLLDNLLWVERYSNAPFTLPAGGGQIAITPKFNLN